jgi:hypothetical protein
MKAKFVNPVTYFFKTKSMSVAYWSKNNNFNIDTVWNVIYGRSENREIVDALNRLGAGAALREVKMRQKAKKQ